MKTTNNSHQVNGNHYEGIGSIEPVHVIAASNLNWFQGEILKYVSRHWRKNGRTDLLKARHISDMAVDLNIKFDIIQFTSGSQGSIELVRDYTLQFVDYFTVPGKEDGQYEFDHEQFKCFLDIIYSILESDWVKIKEKIDQLIEYCYGKE